MEKQEKKNKRNLKLLYKLHGVSDYFKIVNSKLPFAVKKELVQMDIEGKILRFYEDNDFSFLLVRTKDFEKFKKIAPFGKVYSRLRIRSMARKNRDLALFILSIETKEDSTIYVISLSTIKAYEKLYSNSKKAKK